MKILKLFINKDWNYNMNIMYKIKKNLQKNKLKYEKKKQQTFESKYKPYIDNIIMKYQQEINQQQIDTNQSYIQIPQPSKSIDILISD
jgi:hypothetical protein